MRWTDVLLWLLPILLAIPVGILTNIMTPRVQHWLATRSVSRTRTQLARLTSELEEARRFNRSKDQLYIRVLHSVCVLLSIMGMGMAMLILRSVADMPRPILFAFHFTIATGLMALCSIFYLDTVRLLRRAANFDEFEKLTTNEIRRLSANVPPDGSLLIVASSQTDQPAPADAGVSHVPANPPADAGVSQADKTDQPSSK